jgi:hypothetical protein
MKKNINAFEEILKHQHVKKRKKNVGNVNSQMTWEEEEARLRHASRVLDDLKVRRFNKQENSNDPLDFRSTMLAIDEGTTRKVASRDDR